MQSDFREDIQKFKKLEEIFGIKVENSENFLKALTHSSYTREKELDSLENYERLEFLGDAVLKLSVSDILISQFPEYAEGDLTKIRSIVVSDNTLAEIAESVGLNNLIILGKQEEKTGGRERKSIMACAFEAILGAYYLDGKYLEISKFLKKVFESYIKNVDENFAKFNAKAVLQEHTQSLNKQLPEYKIVGEKGPEHDKIFVAEVSYMEHVLATGQGKTKREAEQDAAYKACNKFGIIDEKEV